MRGDGTWIHGSEKKQTLIEQKQKGGFVVVDISFKANNLQDKRKWNSKESEKRELSYEEELSVYVSVYALTLTCGLTSEMGLKEPDLRCSRSTGVFSVG